MRQSGNLSQKIKLMKIFVGSLFLAHERRININQKDLSIPEIYVESLGGA